MILEFILATRIRKVGQMRAPFIQHRADTFSSAQRSFKLHWAGKEVEILQLKILQRNKVKKNVWSRAWVK